jgi:hypothetical protein
MRSSNYIEKERRQKKMTEIKVIEIEELNQQLNKRIRERKNRKHNVNKLMKFNTRLCSEVSQ